MLRAIRSARAGQWPRDQRRATATLAYDERHRRRRRLVSDEGEAFLLDLPQAEPLGEGDGLALAEGGWIEIKARPEALLAISAASPALLCRLAWHLGNRHLPAAIEDGRILIREDHVVEAMLRGLGAEIEHLAAPFTPEPGAYAAAAPPGAAHHRHDAEAEE